MTAFKAHNRHSKLLAMVIVFPHSSWEHLPLPGNYRRNITLTWELSGRVQQCFLWGETNSCDAKSMQKKKKKKDKRDHCKTTEDIINITDFLMFV